MVTGLRGKDCAQFRDGLMRGLFCCLVVQGIKNLFQMWPVKENNTKTKKRDHFGLRDSAVTTPTTVESFSFKFLNAQNESIMFAQRPTSLMKSFLILFYLFSLRQKNSKSSLGRKAYCNLVDPFCLILTKKDFIYNIKWNIRMNYNVSSVTSAHL